MKQSTLDILEEWFEAGMINLENLPKLAEVIDLVEDECSNCGRTTCPHWIEYNSTDEEISLRKWGEWERYVLDYQMEGWEPKIFPDWLKESE